MKTSDLFIKDSCEQGKKMDLKLPNGKIIQNAFTVIGADSDTFADAIAESRKKDVELYELKSKVSPVEYARSQKENKEHLLSVLVTGWEFDEPFSRDAVKKLFVNAPYVLEQIDSFAADRGNFFAKPSMD